MSAPKSTTRKTTPTHIAILKFYSTKERVSKKNPAPNQLSLRNLSELKNAGLIKYNPHNHSIMGRSAYDLTDAGRSLLISGQGPADKVRD